MNKAIKIVIIIGVSLLVVGCVIFVVAMSANGWDFSALSSEYEKKTLVATEEKSVVVLDFQNSDVQVKYDQVDYVSVEYSIAKGKDGKELNAFDIVDENGKLSLVERRVVQTWFFGFNVKPTATLILPNALCDLTVKTDNGKIVIDNSVKGDFGKVEFDTDNGEIDVRGDMTCSSLTATTNNGKITFGGKLSVDGDVKAESDNGKITVNGEVKARGVRLETDNGEVSSSAVINAENVYLKTANGGITVTLAGKNADYVVTAKTGNGSCNVVDSDSGSRTLVAKTGNGAIKISFVQD